MSVYDYRASTAEGKKVRGKVEADSLVRAQTQLREMHLATVQLKEHRNILHKEITKKKVKRIEVMHFSRQLAAFIRAGVPIVHAITVVAEESSERMQEVLSEVVADLRGGDTFSVAMANHPQVFPRYYLDILQSAELTGGLDAVLDQLAGYLERDLEARRKLTSALVYPTLVLLMACVTVLVLMSYVLPRFKDFFENFDAELPLPTRLLIAFGDFLSNWWWALLLGAVVLGLGILLALRTDKGKYRKDAMLLRIPAVGTVVRCAVLERFCRILAAMVNAGVPLPDAMAVATESAGNRVYRNALSGARERMIKGDGLADPLDDTGLFPGVAAQVLRVGEETGTLDEQLVTAAQFYEIELDFKLKRLTSLFEPAIIIFVGVVVGFVALALVSAMYGIFNQVDV